MICTTLNDIKSFYPCDQGWKTLLKHLKKTKADDFPLPLAEILRSNGLFHALWATQCVYKTHKKEMILLSLQIARTVQHLMKDRRSIAALDVIHRFANGEATEAELQTARRSALAARGDAAAPVDAYASSVAVAATAVTITAVTITAGAATAIYDISSIATSVTVTAYATSDTAYTTGDVDTAAVKAKLKEIERIFLEFVA